MGRAQRAVRKQEWNGNRDDGWVRLLNVQATSQCCARVRTQCGGVGQTVKRPATWLFFAKLRNEIAIIAAVLEPGRTLDSRRTLV